VKRLTLLSVLLAAFCCLACSDGFEKSSNRSAENLSSVWRTLIWKPNSKNISPDAAEEQKNQSKKQDKKEAN
jgi:hypothetical protein